MDATRAGLVTAPPPVDLVVWPETMVPGAGFEVEANRLLRQIDQARPGNDHLFIWADAVRAFQAEIAVPMLVGSTAWVGARFERDGDVVRLELDGEFNAAYLVDGPPPHPRYDKVHLTPFGETMPYISAWPWLEEKLLAIGAAGMSFNLDASPVIRTPGAVR